MTTQLDRLAEGDADPALGVNVIGYLDDALGVAEAARLYVETLRAAGIAVTTTAVHPDRDQTGRDLFTRAGRRPYPHLRAAAEPSFNLLCLQGERLEAFINAGGHEMLGHRSTIGQWAWETDVLPDSWLSGFDHLDEIWVNSTFVASCLCRLSPVPVVVVPQGLTVIDPASPDPGESGEAPFTFLFMMDFFSTLRRKNPAGLIEAFCRAFSPGEGPRLVLKTINAEHQKQAAGELRRKIAGRRDIELVDGYLDPPAKVALIAGADCYVSLHRSEGFGLTLAESMALETPVIATGYSGNLDFMTPYNSYLVDWQPTEVGPGCEIYPADGHWADPDLDDAAALMRRVWKRPEEAAAKAQRAKADIARLYAPQTVGAIARERLEVLSERMPGARRRRAVTRFQEIEQELSFDLRLGAPPGPRGLGGLLRRLVLRLMLPFTYHERKLDRAMLSALRELQAELDRLRDQLES